MASANGNRSLLKIKRVALGVRYVPQFRVSDKLGKISDEILRAKNSSFNSDVFPLITRTPGEYSLGNSTTKDQLLISQRDTILIKHVNTTLLEDIKALAQDFQIEILDILRDEVNLRDITRYGVAFELENLAGLLGSPPRKHFLSSDFKNADSLEMKFTHRLPLMEAHVKKGVDDYVNIIYEIREYTERDIINISVDYQEYYKPPLDPQSWQKKRFTDFVTKAANYFNGEFSDWINKLSKPTKVA